MTVAELRERLRDLPATAPIRFQGITDDNFLTMVGDIADCFRIGHVVTLTAVIGDAGVIPI